MGILNHTPDRKYKVLASLVGCACGDALGLHREGLSAWRANRIFPDPDRYSFIGRWGTTSDDYDHACMAMEAIAASGGDASFFARELANRTRLWAACIPGGIGLATLRSSLKLWLGYGPDRSGVFSAGNGPAMRSHILGVAIDDLDQLAAFVRASTRISHTDPKALTGAMIIALASRHSSTAEIVNSEAFLAEINEQTHRLQLDPDFIPVIADVVKSVSRRESTREFSTRFGKFGVSGYIYHTVPVVIHAWLCFPNAFADAVKAAISCGGDTDTMASIVGGIVGARVGIEGIPDAWIADLILWPRTLNYLEALTDGLESKSHHQRINAFHYLLRNAWFNPVVLTHGFRRLLPPY